MGPVKPYRLPPPWKSTSLVHISSPKTPRAKFINSFLPEFYKTKFKHCKNNKKFVKGISRNREGTVSLNTAN